jgi:hypothetical protein
VSEPHRRRELFEEMPEAESVGSPSAVHILHANIDRAPKCAIAPQLNLRIPSHRINHPIRITCLPIFLLKIQNAAVEGDLFTSVDRITGIAGIAGTASLYICLYKNPPSR